MNTENQERRKHKRYDEAFKRQAVELWLSGNKSVQQVAAELGVSDQSLKQWKKKLVALPATGAGQRSPQQLEQQVQLHQQRERLRQLLGRWDEQKDLPPSKKNPK